MEIFTELPVVLQKITQEKLGFDELVLLVGTGKIKDLTDEQWFELIFEQTIKENLLLDRSVDIFDLYEEESRFIPVYYDGSRVLPATKQELKKVFFKERQYQDLFSSFEFAVYFYTERLNGVTYFSQDFDHLIRELFLKALRKKDNKLIDYYLDEINDLLLQVKDVKMRDVLFFRLFVRSEKDKKGFLKAKRFAGQNTEFKTKWELKPFFDFSNRFSGQESKLETEIDSVLFSDYYPDSKTELTPAAIGYFLYFYPPNKTNIEQIKNYLIDNPINLKELTDIMLGIPDIEIYLMLQELKNKLNN